MNIIYCTDGNETQTRLIELSAKSVRKFNPSAKIYILTDTPPDEQLSALADEVRKCDFRGKFFDAFFKAHDVSLGVQGYGSFMRLAIPAVFADLDKALYLDSDILCKGSLESFYDKRVDYIAAVECPATKMATQKIFYAMGGVLLLNIAALNEINFTATAFGENQEILSRFKCINDETILNVLFKDKIKFVDKIYNYFYGDEMCDAWSYRGADAVLVHFIGKLNGEKNNQTMFDYYARYIENPVKLSIAVRYNCGARFPDDVCICGGGFESRALDKYRLAKDMLNFAASITPISGTIKILRPDGDSIYTLSCAKQTALHVDKVNFKGTSRETFRLCESAFPIFAYGENVEWADAFALKDCGTVLYIKEEK